MDRRQFIKGSAIIGASAIIPIKLYAESGLLTAGAERKVHKILKANSTMVGTLPILRAFAGNHLDYVSPYVLFDEFGPVNLKEGSDPLRVNAHPHAGIIPTTYFLEGSGHHKDSLNYDFQVSKGEFMMFQSGRGAIHMEETGQALHDEGGNYHGFQIWLNMASKDKFSDPATFVYKEDKMPTLITKDYTMQVVLGQFGKTKSGIELLTPAFYYHIKLHPGKKIEIPTDPTHNAFLYGIKGKMELELQQSLEANQIALYERGESTITVYSEKGADFLALGGKPLNEPVFSYGPFVMNTADEIRECIRAYQSGEMGDPDKVN
ncbi:pirin family protein [bacterium]|nr:pirin family protein [bacterium]